MPKPVNADYVPTLPTSAQPVTAMNDTSHRFDTMTGVRPNNATAYTALDVWADNIRALWTFRNMARVPGGSGYVIKAAVYSTLKTDVDQYRLHIYNVPPITLIADNSPYLLLAVDIQKRVGYINLPATFTEDSTNSTMAMAIAVPGTGSGATASNLPLEFQCAPGDMNLYAVVEVVLGHTPAALDQLTVSLWSEPSN